MNDDKPLNIAADQPDKPDLTVTSGDFRQTTPNKPAAPLQTAQTPLQAELAETLGKVTPPGTIKPAMPSPPAPEVSKDGKIVPGQKPIRTYESDIADVLSHHKVSTASIAIAENKKKQQKEKDVPAISSISDEPKKSYAKQIILALLSIIFIGGGIVGGYYLYENSVLAVPAPTPKPLVISSIVPPDKQTVFNIDSFSQSQIIPQIYSQINSASIPAGSDGAGIFELVLAEKSGDANTRVTASSFIQKTGIAMPDALLRSLTDTWMLGAYEGTDGEKTPFVILTTDFFQNAYAGMLGWEATMPDDLSGLLNYEQTARAGDSNASTSISSYFGIRGSFIDKEIQNRDVREFIGTQGEVLSLYSFINDSTLVLTTSEDALSGIISRIEKQTYVR